MQIVIDIPEEDYEYLKLHNKDGLYNAILNGKPLPKGHGRIVDESKITKCEKVGIIIKDGSVIPCITTNAPTIIEADKKYEVEIITRGNCMMCGKKLTEGLFFCKECEDKASSRK